MPLIWSYLLIYDVKILLLSLFSIIALLGMMRLDEVAHVASLGATWQQILTFAGLQIPYLLPIALPLSALLASFLTLKSFSISLEFTAMRASGLSLSMIIAPLLMMASLLALFNLYLASELGPQAHHASSVLRSQLRRVNPLLLINNKNLLQFQGIAGDILGRVQHGESAESVFLAFPPKKGQRMQLLFAKKLQVTSKAFEGLDVSFVGGQRTPETAFDQLWIENTGYFVMELGGFSSLLQQRTELPHPDQLNLKVLLRAIGGAESKKATHTFYTDLVRRFSLGIAVFALTLLGAACGIQTGRGARYLPTTVMVLLTALYLVAYFFAKSFEDRLQLSIAALLIPHVIMIAYALWRLCKINKGSE